LNYRYAVWEFRRPDNPFGRLDPSLHDDGGQIEIKGPIRIISARKATRQERRGYED
jgi:hypothetical protein